MAKTVLFICTGNYYRSRYAQALFNHLAGERGLDWTAYSRGLMTWQVPRNSLSPETQFALKLKKIERSHAGDGPTQLEASDLESSTKAIALKRDEHYPMMSDMFPDWAESIDYWNVHDLDCATMEEAILAIDKLVQELIDEIATATGAAKS